MNDEIEVGDIVGHPEHSSRATSYYRAVVTKTDKYGAYAIPCLEDGTKKEHGWSDSWIGGHSSRFFLVSKKFKPIPLLHIGLID